jgi:hypothetical protein
VLVAGREGRDGTDAIGQALDQRRRPGLGGAGEDRRSAGATLHQLFGAIGTIVPVQSRRVVAAQALLDRIGQPAGHEDDGFGAGHRIGPGRGGHGFTYPVRARRATMLATAGKDRLHG